MTVNSASGFRSLHPSVGQVASSGSRLPAAIELGDGGSDCCLEARFRQFYRIGFFFKERQCECHSPESKQQRENKCGT